MWLHAGEEPPRGAFRLPTQAHAAHVEAHEVRASGEKGAELLWGGDGGGAEVEKDERRAPRRDNERPSRREAQEVPAASGASSSPAA